jgi:hypothetical protein
MKRMMLIGFAACTFAVPPMFPVAAMSLAPMTPAITAQVNNDIIMVRRGGRGHHYGWTQSRGRHLGFTRGRHRGWH